MPNVLFDIAMEIINPISIVAESLCDDFINSIKEKRVVKNKLIILKEKVFDLLDRYSANRIVLGGLFDYFCKYEFSPFLESIIKFDIYFDNSEKERLDRLINICANQFSKENYVECKECCELIYNVYKLVVYFRLSIVEALSSYKEKAEINIVLNQIMSIREVAENVMLAVHNEIKELFENRKVSELSMLPSLQASNVSKNTIESFVEKFNAPMIFEYGEKSKSLNDVYVWPEYELLQSPYSIIFDDLEKMVYALLEGNSRDQLKNKKLPQILIEKKYNSLTILGWAGIGKSSLVRKIASCYYKDFTRFEHAYFIRFSDIVVSNNNLLDGICNLYQISKYDLRNSLLVLDAYDEYDYIFDSIQDNYLTRFLKEVNAQNCFVIVTSRDGYINIDQLYDSLIIRLKTLNPTKRKQWLLLYKPEMDIQMMNEIVVYRDEKDKNGEEFIGIPIILYMIAAHGLCINQYLSKFQLYDKLFGSNGVWIERLYDEPDYKLLSYRQEAYNFILSLACKLFTNGASKLVLNSNEVKKIFDECLSQKAPMGIIKRLCGIVVHSKNNKMNEVEFAHKSIYEFLLSAYIFNQIKRMQDSSDAVFDFFISFFCTNRVSNEVYGFLNGFFQKEMNTGTNILHLIKTFYENSLEEYLYFSKEGASFSPELASCGLYNINQLFRKMLVRDCKLYSPNNHCLKIFLNMADYSGMELTYSDFSNQDFSRKSMNGIDFSNSDFSKCNLSHCYLMNSNITNCNLKDANLYGAVLGNAIFVNSDIRGANLNNVSIFETTDRIDNWLNAKIDICQLKHFVPRIFNRYKGFKIYSHDIPASEQEILRELDRLGRVPRNFT